MKNNRFVFGSQIFAILGILFLGYSALRMEKRVDELLDNLVEFNEFMISSTDELIEKIEQKNANLEILIQGNSNYHIVQGGESLYKISRNNTGASNPREILEETNRIAELNGMGTTKEFPWHPNYNCKTASERDPNCIYPEQTLNLQG